MGGHEEDQGRLQGVRSQGDPVEGDLPAGPEGEVAGNQLIGGRNHADEAAADGAANSRTDEKEIDEQVKKLTTDLESMAKELEELERLQTAAEEIAVKKSEKGKKK